MQDSSPQSVILKFGGASVSSPSCFAKIADIISDRQKKYCNVAVVVSAMGNTTDDLISLAQKVHPEPPKREMDMLLTVGERISISLLAMALDLKGCQAVSYTGSQCGIITSNHHTQARIVEIRPKRLISCFKQNKIAIVAGFQGMSLEGNITTLGRGGTDTTAVALAVALGASHVEFFKDVAGVYTDNPRKNPNAELCQNLGFQEAAQIAATGDFVLMQRALLLAQQNAVALRVLPFADAFNDAIGTWIGREDRKNELSPEKVYEEG